MAESDSEKCNLLADCFAAQCAVRHADTFVPSNDSSNSPDELFSLSEVTCEEITQSLKSLCPHKSCGGDIPTRVLRSTGDMFRHRQVAD